MAYRGRAPKPDDERVRRNAPAFQRIPVEWDGLVRGPGLPKNYSWCKATIQWWEEFRRSPQSMVCIDTDWQFLLDTALIHDRIWRDPNSLPAPHLTNLMSEFRRRMGAYGYTFDDRLKQRIDVRSPAVEAAEKAEIQHEAKKAVDYMEMLTQEAAKIQD